MGDEICEICKERPAEFIVVRQYTTDPNEVKKRSLYCVECIPFPPEVLADFRQNAEIWAIDTPDDS